MATGGTRGKTEWKFVRGDGGVLRASRSIYRAASDYFFGNTPEHAFIQPDNLEI